MGLLLSPGQKVAAASQSMTIASDDALFGTAADAAWTSGSGSAIALLKAIAAQAISTTPVQTFESNSFSNLLANATTTVKSGAGTLVGININTKGASANTLTIYDNTAGSGTKIGTVDTVNGVIGHIPFKAAFATGLTVVIATGTAADITVIYR
jgi:hypothetical protein